MGKNIVLIGLPGCGKTTVGKILSKNMKRKLIDMDALIVAQQKRSINEIFASDGEKYFRDLETECAKKVGAMQDVVIATGGGVVLKKENMDALKSNGMIYFLDRSTKAIAANVDVSHRPLQKNDPDYIFQLQKERDKLYRKYANAVYSGGTPKELAEAVQLMFEMTELTE